MKCNTHKRYTATYQPRTLCMKCLRMYCTNHPREGAMLMNFRANWAAMPKDMSVKVAVESSAAIESGGGLDDTVL